MMTTFKQLLYSPVGKGDVDTFLLRLAQITCFVTAALVFLFGLRKLERLDLTEAQLFSGVLQVAQTALLFSVPAKQDLLTSDRMTGGNRRQGKPSCPWCEAFWNLEFGIY